MSKPMDAEYHGEERYSKLSIAYTGTEEEAAINTAIEVCSKGCSIMPNIYGCDISNGRKVIVIEYQDDYDREAGDVFEKILKHLDIKLCD
ncbi:MAG: hypothetical protein GQ570_08955 [Helicobacteraceae bacterium]|nr:hypothetical protein [Helicobacteraceae bacterium]